MSKPKVRKVHLTIQQGDMTTGTKSNKQKLGLKQTPLEILKLYSPGKLQQFISSTRCSTLGGKALIQEGELTLS